MTYLQNQASYLVQSVRLINKRVGLVLLYDLCFYATVSAISFLFMKIVEIRANAIDLSGNILDLAPLAAKQLTTQVQYFYFMLNDQLE